MVEEGNSRNFRRVFEVVDISSTAKLLSLGVFMRFLSEFLWFQ